MPEVEFGIALWVSNGYWMVLAKPPLFKKKKKKSFKQQITLIL